MKMMRLKEVGVLLVMAGLLAGCFGQGPAAEPPAALTPIVEPTQPPAAPDTPTAVPVEPATPAETPATEPMTDTGAGAGGAVEGPVTSPDTGMAVVEGLDVRILESFPVQVQAVVTGYLPDGCTTITGVEATNEGTTFRIRIATDRPADAMCTQQVVPFEQVVGLNTTGLPAGNYQVVVNDVSVGFDLPSSEAPAEPSQPEAGEHPVVETTTGFVMAQVDVPIYDAPSEDGAEIGLIAGGQMARVTGASPDGAWWRVICPDESVGDCWVPAAPEMTVPASPPN
jgi:hypothetical protein